MKLQIKKNRSLDFDIVKNLIKYLELAFSNPDEKNIAQRKLHKPCQTN